MGKGVWTSKPVAAFLWLWPAMSSFRAKRSMKIEGSMMGTSVWLAGQTRLGQAQLGQAQLAKLSYSDGVCLPD